MEPLRISLFGVFDVEHQGQKVDTFKSCKVKELICYLILNPGGRHSREKLATLLADQCSTLQSRAYLRKVLWQLQQSLDPLMDATGLPLLNVENEWIQLRLNDGIWIDVQAFQETYATVKGQPGYTLTEDQFEQLQRAIHLYKGDLLETCYKDWCIHERERLKEIYLVMLDKLMSACEVRQAYEQGIGYGHYILCHDEAREHTHRQMMRLHYLAGKRTAALRQFKKCTAQLETHLGVSPAESTMQLYQQICDGNLIPLGQARAQATVPDHAALPLHLITPPEAQSSYNLNELRSGMLILQRQMDVVLQYFEIKRTA